jgi:hypothetical protein
MTIDYMPVVDWLSYKSYEHNRLNSPHIPYYRWRKIYKDAIAFEEIFQTHMNKLLGSL